MVRAWFAHGLHASHEPSPFCMYDNIIVTAFQLITILSLQFDNIIVAAGSLMHHCLGIVGAAQEIVMVVAGPPAA